MIITLKGIIKVDTGEKWHILPLVETSSLGIEIRNWEGRWLEIIVE